MAINFFERQDEARKRTLLLLGLLCGWPGAVLAVLLATLTAMFATNSGRSAWFVGVLMIFVYAVFAITLYMLPPQVPVAVKVKG